MRNTDELLRLHESGQAIVLTPAEHQRLVVEQGELQRRMELIGSLRRQSNLSNVGRMTQWPTED